MQGDAQVNERGKKTCCGFFFFVLNSFAFFLFTAFLLSCPSEDNCRLGLLYSASVLKHFPAVGLDSSAQKPFQKCCNFLVCISPPGARTGSGPGNLSGTQTRPDSLLRTKNYEGDVCIEDLSDWSNSGFTE